MTITATFPVGTRVRLTQDVDRYPHFIAPAGAIGTVVFSDDDGYLSIHMDETIPGAEEWGNEVQFLADDGGDDEIDDSVEVIQ